MNEQRKREGCVPVCVCIHIHPHTHEMFLNFKREGNFVILTTGMKLQDIMLSEISQTKTNTMCSHAHMESKKHQLKEAELKMVVARD